MHELLPVRCGAPRLVRDEDSASAELPPSPFLLLLTPVCRKGWSVSQTVETLNHDHKK